jgi:DNA-binding transcriptional MerR regulator
MAEPSRTLTVGDITDAILRAGEDRDALIARIRHWTREGLLQTVDDRRSGTGHHRQYPLSAVLVAAVLNVLVDMGFQAGPLRGLLREPRHPPTASAQTREKSLRFRQQIRDSFLGFFLNPAADLWYKISYFRAGEYSPAIGLQLTEHRFVRDPDAKHQTESSGDVILSINLRQIFGDIRGDDLLADLRAEAHRRLDQRKPERA